MRWSTYAELFCVKKELQFRGRYDGFVGELTSRPLPYLSLGHFPSCLISRMPHFLDVVVKVVPDGLAESTPSGGVRMAGSACLFRLDQSVNGESVAFRDDKKYNSLRSGRRARRCAVRGILGQSSSVRCRNEELTSQRRHGNMRLQMFMHAGGPFSRVRDSRNRLCSRMGQRVARSI